MLPPAPVPSNVVVGATVVKRFPGYGERRGTIAEIDLDGGKVVVRWATDESTISLGEAAKWALYAIPPTEEEEEDGDSTIAYDSGDDTADYEGDGGDALTTTSSRFWGVTWCLLTGKWKAQYLDADGKGRYLGLFDDDEEAARAVNKAICDAGLEGKRRTNAVDATGALVPKSGHWRELDRSAVVAPDPARAASATTSKFWGVHWAKSKRRWAAQYNDADGKRHNLGCFDTQEAAARAYNAAIRRAGLEGRRKTNPVVDGQLVPKPPRKRRREEPAATPSRRSPRRR